MKTPEDPMRIPFYILSLCVLFFVLIALFPLPVKILEETDFLSELRAGTDSIPETETADSLVAEMPVAAEKPISKSKPLALDSLSQLFQPLNDFFASLAERDSSKKIHIAYFGDSMIEGDLITNDLRKKMQSRFGGNGVGFVPIYSITAGFRTSIIHTFSKDWTTYSFVNKKKDGFHVCPTGYVHIAGNGSFVRYAVSKEYRLFKNATLFFGKTDGAKIEVQTDTLLQTFSLKGSSGVNELVLHEGSSFSKMKITSKNDNVPFFGVNFENGSGVYIDNYSFRGCSGVPLSEIPDDIFTGFSVAMNDKLIVLHYGLNIVSHSTKNYDWYIRSFRKVVRHIKELNPGVSILLVSAGDKGYRENGTWISEPNIPVFVKIQEKLAREEGVGFWNLYESMGGENSMIRWVQEKPAKANADYEHPNFRGAAEIAQLFYDYLMKGYDHYLLINKKTETLATSK